jgi:hypothetical protein
MPRKSVGLALLGVLYTGICLTTVEQRTDKTSVSLIEKCQLSAIQCIVMAAFAGSQDKLSIPISLL